ncbi:ABC transporter permease, partial [Streptococcus pyogenes]
MNTKKTFLKKFYELIITLLIVSVLSFVLMKLSPVDPATAYAKRHIGSPSPEQIEEVRIRFGFDKPVYKQYFNWIKNLFSLDLGQSLSNGKPVWDNIMLALPKTLSVVFFSAILQVILVLSLGCITFLWKSKIINKLINLLCLIGVSIPSFYIAIILLDIFAVKWDLLSVACNIGITNYLLPAITLGIFGASFYYPLFKDALDKENGEYYIMFFRANGLKEFTLFVKHILPNSIVKLIPNFFQSIGLMIANVAI